MLSILVPVRNESENLEGIFEHFQENIKNLNYEVLLINDFSEDDTLDRANKLTDKYKNFKILDNKKKGLGGAINLGIIKSSGKNIAIMMADQSDDINDLIRYNEIMNTHNCDAVFGSRFLNESKVNDYPIQKLILNRIFNNFVRIIFFSRYNDFTNAFKIYKRKSLLELLPMVSENFNVFLEIPLKIISRNYSYLIIPINWNNRKHGKSKFKIKELGSMYIFTLLYCFIEKILLKKSLKKVI